MNARAAAITAAAAMALWYLLKDNPKRTAIVTIEDIDSGSGFDSSPFVFAPDPDPIPQTGAITPAQALQVASDFNNRYFGGWFSRDGRSLSMVVAIWTQESRLGALPVGDGGRSLGIGHVLGSTAADRGFNDPQALLQLDTGARASMEHMRWSWDELTRYKNGTEPTIAEWIASYNRGAYGVAVLGRRGLDYLQAVGRHLSEGVRAVLA